MVHGLFVEAEPIVDKFLQKGIHYFYLCGGRGIGKTYGCLDLCKKLATGEKKLSVPTSDGIEEVEGKFMYLRRTRIEAESVASPESCPFKNYNKSEGTDIYADFSSKLGFGNFYLTTGEETREHIGYCAGLSTFSNLRGVDFSDVVLILYDECIPENTSKAPLKNEAMLFLNMLETVNRNRAILGLPEVVVILLSNPIDLANALLTGLHFTEIITSMAIKGQQRYTDYNRSLHIEVLKNHKVSQLKGEKSSLYKFAKGTGFLARALSGDFVDNDLAQIGSVPLSEYKCLAEVAGIYVYEHKTENRWHICSAKQTPVYSLRASERERIKSILYWGYKQYLITSSVTYESVAIRAAFESLIGYK